MKRCNSCKIIILDDTHVCPLCRQVLEEDGVPQENRYPDVIGAGFRLRFLKNLTLLLSIVAMAVLTVLCRSQVVAGSTVFLTGLILIYVNVLLRLSILGKAGYRFKIISGLVFSALVLEGVDVLTGDKGWSMELVWPACVLMLDLVIVILMIINRRNWQSYMMQQLLAVLLSLVPLLLLKLGRIHYPYVIWISAGASGLLFLSTLIMGDRRAREELYRRFHL